MRVLGNPLARVTLELGLPSEAFFPAVPPVLSHKTKKPWKILIKKLGA